MIRRAAVILAALSSVFFLASCGQFMATAGSDRANQLAHELVKRPMEGFTFSEIRGPDFGFDTRNTDSSFSATPTSGEFDSSQCATVIDWANRTLKNTQVSGIQYNSSDMAHAQYGCQSVAGTNWIPAFSLAGLYKNVVIEMILEVGVVTINVDSENYTLKDVIDPNANDPKIVSTSEFLEQLADYRKTHSIKFFTDSDVTKVWDQYAQSQTLKPKASWRVDNDGKVHRVYFDFGKSGLLPFWLSIDPWNVEKYGEDPGPAYLVILQPSEDRVTNFGQGMSGEFSTTTAIN